MGNWVAAVQRADDDGNGKISLENNRRVSWSANFDMGEITADPGPALPPLRATSPENTFSGDEGDMVPATNAIGITAGTGKFTGTFSGGFYGAAGGGSRWYLRLYVGRCGRRCVPRCLWWQKVVSFDHLTSYQYQAPDL